jgi:hypothetical protein
LCPVIVTSRLVGYDDAQLPDEFDELILEKFDDSEVLSYCTKFMKVVGGHDEKTASQRAASFCRQTINNAADLRRQAARAWEWYGLIDRDLITKHGVVTYYNTSLGGILGIDGLSAMALCASPGFNAHFPETVSRKAASKALSAVGSVGFATLPLPKALFSKQGNGDPPLFIWERLLKEHAASAGSLAGCFFVMLVSTEIANQHEEHQQAAGGRRRISSRNKLIEFVMKNAEFQKSKSYPLVRRALERGSMFI